MKFWCRKFKSISLTNILALNRWIWKFGANKNWGKWSEIVAFIFPEITSGEIIVENRLSIKVFFKCLVSLVGCKIYDIKGFEAWESKTSLVGQCLV